VVDEFWAELQKQGGPNCAPPATSAGKFVMMHAARGQLLLVGALARDVPAYLVIELLDRVGGLLELYLKELNEDALRANFVTVYQLLDEIIDNGFPLHTEPNVLQELVMQPGKMESMMASVTGASHVRGALPESTNSIAPWRRSGVRYAANELYLDLVERLDATVDGRNGVLQRADVWGEAQCNCQLSGVPRLTLSFTSPHILEDVSLHPAISRDRWERERVMSFVPPDGKFELFSYHVTRTNQLPIYVTPVISFASSTPTFSSSSSSSAIGSSVSSYGGAGHTSSHISSSNGSEGAGGSVDGVGHVSITLGARPTEGKPVEDVSVRMPLPESTINAALTATVGVAVFDERTKEVTWKVGRIPKDKNLVLSGTVTLGAGRSHRDLSISLFVGFKVTMYSSSGLKVASLRVENEEHQPYKGVRSITKSGVFEVRC